MKILDKLARNLGERGEGANIEMAEEIVAQNDSAAIKEIVENLSNKDKKIQADCMKVLYEIGERKPGLIAAYYKEFLDLLGSKNLRMVWGTTCALSAIALEKPKELYEAIPQILSVVEKTQSVIARDHAVEILSKLGTIEKYNEDAFQLLSEIILAAPINQVAMYAERTADIVSAKNKGIFRDALICRLDDVSDYPAKKKRIEKVLKNLEM